MARDTHSVTRVLLVAPRMEPRGTSEYSVYLARQLRRLGVDVAVACAGGPMLEMLKDADVAVRTFQHLENLWLRQWEKRDFVQAVRAFGPRLVHGQSLRIAGALKLLDKKTDLPLVLTTHWVPSSPRRLRRLARRLDGLIVTTQAVREGVVNNCSVPREKVVVIHNGVEVERLEADPAPPIFRSGVPVVGSLGPIEEQRGHELFVRAASILVGRGVAAQFLVAGEGQESDRIRGLIRNLGLARSVTLATDFTAYEDVLDAIDIVVQSSQVDVSGYSILEAMGRGRPVVAFNTGTACEMVEEGRTGLLVPKGEINALAEAIRRLIDDPEFARRMAEEARRRVKDHFNARSLARQTRDYYAGLIAE